MVEAGIPIVPTMRVPGDFGVLDRVAAWMNEKGERYLCPKALRETRSLLQAYQEGITPEMAQTGYHPDMSMLERGLPVAMENMRRLHAAGAVIGCGTDSGGDPFAVFGRICDEIDYLLEAGLSTFEALCSATVVNARILGLEDRLGTIEAGKVADFVVLDGNPLADITSLQRVQRVVQEGKTVYYEKSVADAV
jgi:imidazolonepropionase-like amidohydrolase